MPLVVHAVWSVDYQWMGGGHMVQEASSIRRAALASRACMEVDDVDNAGRTLADLLYTCVPFVVADGAPYLTVTASCS